MNLIIHRGTHEIGGSCVEVKSRNSRIVIDIGAPIVSPSGERVDYRKLKDLSYGNLIASNILPDISGLNNQDNGSFIDGLLISHPHLDHYGLYNFVDKGIQYYLGEDAHKLINLSNIFIEDRGAIEKFKYIQDSKEVQIGDFKVTPFLMDHSADDAYAFLIEADGKKLFYSGDFRSHGRTGHRFDKFVAKPPVGIDALILEGTLIEDRESKYKTEVDVEEAITKVLRANNTIVFCIAASQNIERMVSFFNAAKGCKRLFVIDVYAANILSSIGKRTIPHPSKCYSNIKVFFPKPTCDVLNKSNKEDMIKVFGKFKIAREEISKRQSEILMMVRPSVKSYLEKISNIGASPLIYSMWEGYLKDEKNKGFIEYITKGEAPLECIHTSGHADLNTLKKLVKSLDAKKIVPIHTMSPKKYKDYFKNVIEAEDGEEIEI